MVGVSGLTHRLIAARAGVPLGSTTYYFGSLNDLAREALEAAGAETRQELDRWVDALAASSDIAATLTDLMVMYLEDREQTLLWSEVYVAAVHRSELLPLSRQWSEGVVAILDQYTSHQAALATTIFLDGVLLHALLNEQTIDPATMTMSLRLLLHLEASGQS